MDHLVALTLAALHGVPTGLIVAATGAVTPRGQRSPAVVMIALLTVIAAVAAWFLAGPSATAAWPMLMVIPGGLLMAFTGNELRRRPDGATTGPLTGLVGTLLLALGVFAQALDVFRELTDSRALHLTGLIGMTVTLVLTAGMFVLGANGPRAGRLPMGLAWAALVGGGLFVLQGLVLGASMIWPAVPPPSAVMVGVGAIMASLIPRLASQQAKGEQAQGRRGGAATSGTATDGGSTGVGRGKIGGGKAGGGRPGGGEASTGTEDESAGGAGAPSKPSGQRQQPRRKGRRR